MKTSIFFVVFITSLLFTFKVYSFHIKVRGGGDGIYGEIVAGQVVLSNDTLDVKLLVFLQANDQLAIIPLQTEIIYIDASAHNERYIRRK